MITSLIEMLELASFGHLTTSTVFDSRDKTEGIFAHPTPYPWAAPKGPILNGVKTRYLIEPERFCGHYLFMNFNGS